MTDPWDTFTHEAVGREVVGYFEEAGRTPGAAGRATWFTRPVAVRALGPRSDPTDAARALARFLSAGRRRAVIGYLGFDAVGLFEPRLRPGPDGGPFPVGEFAFVERPSRAWVPARARTAQPSAGGAHRPVEDSLPLREFERGVRRLVEEIRAGEAYQVVLAHRRAFPRPDDLLRRAGRLRASERYSFFYYLRSGDREILGATPESVAEVRGSRGFVNPIAGTIPRGRGARGRRPLAADPKELAEHRMLVDLARNDLGSVALPGSVRLRSRERLERYARLDHLVTRVAARLRPGVGPWEVLAAAFPAGTVAGAPKIRATELLRREEATWRGPYAGTVGLIEPGGRAAWALAIRTAFAARDLVYTAAGAGIVHRSEPRREFDETLTKLAQVESAVVGRRG
jgi:anthranilate/para-aminobenzoate synthase component I